MPLARLYDAPVFPRSLAWLTVCLLLAVLPRATEAFSVVPPTFRELVNESSRIVQAQVIAVEAFRTISPTGHPLIKTRVTWEVASVLKGTVAETMTLEFLGGRIGGEALTVSGMPRFQVGDRDFLFVEPNEHVICPLIAAGHGRYPIAVNAVSGRAEVRRSNGAALTQTAQVAASLDETASAPDVSAALTPEEFAAAVRSVLMEISSRE